METEEVANKLVNEWIGRYGVPVQILSDRGKSFQSMLIELVFDLLDIKQLRTTAYHPACDGQSERTIRTVKGMIRSFVEENNWE